jgi:hypothetical protein
MVNAGEGGNPRSWPTIGRKDPLHVQNRTISRYQEELVCILLDSADRLLEECRRIDHWIDYDEAFTNAMHRAWTAYVRLDETGRFKPKPRKAKP